MYINAKPLNKYAGFTLIEILIVLAIMAIMTAVVSLSIGSPRDRIFKSNLLKISNLLEVLADQAVYTNTLITCKITDDIICQSYKNNEWGDLNLNSLVSWKWPQKIQIVEITVDGQALGDDQVIRFPPSGEIEQMSFHVTDGKENAWIDGSLDGEFKISYLLKKNKGFTLIECLVALFIIAIVLASATKSIGMTVDDVEDTTAREAANWIVNNQYASYRIDGTFPDLGKSEKTVEMISRSFIVKSVVSATPNPFFRRIDISVVRADEPYHVLFKTVNFISQY